MTPVSHYHDFLPLAITQTIRDEQMT